MRTYLYLPAFLVALLGVLVFGTPTLLLMGHDFVTTLCYLLPASFAISS